MIRFISMREVRNRTSLSKTTIHKELTPARFRALSGLEGAGSPSSKHRSRSG
jgi:hypothetical protein